MMDLKWSSRAMADLERLYDFLAVVNKPAAARVVRSIVAAPARLVEHPYLGEKLEEFAPRDVRRILVGQYELRYEIQNGAVIVLRLWHTRESR